MGCCLGRDHSTEGSEDFEHTICIGKNRPLVQERLKWESEVPITDGQLRSRRDEFWETAPAFEGRQEIWDALRAAAGHAEHGDYALAQAILDGANISLPNGTLSETYDELGNRYQVPIYCLFSPVNLVEDHSESSISSSQQDINSISAQPSSNVIDASKAGDKSATDVHQAMQLLFRLSTDNRELKMAVRMKETVLQAKKRLYQLDQGAPVPSQQRWYFGGRLLSDKMKLTDIKLQSNFVVQVIVMPANSKESSKNSKDSTNLNNDIPPIKADKKSTTNKRQSVTSVSGGSASIAQKKEVVTVSVQNNNTSAAVSKTVIIPAEVCLTTQQAERKRSKQFNKTTVVIKSRSARFKSSTTTAPAAGKEESLPLPQLPTSVVSASTATNKQAPIELNLHCAAASQTSCANVDDIVRSPCENVVNESLSSTSFSEKCSTSQHCVTPALSSSAFRLHFVNSGNNTVDQSCNNNGNSIILRPVSCLTTTTSNSSSFAGNLSTARDAINITPTPIE